MEEPSFTSLNCTIPNLFYHQAGNLQSYDYCQQLLADMKLILLHNTNKRFIHHPTERKHSPQKYCNSPHEMPSSVVRRWIKRLLQYCNEEENLRGYDFCQKLLADIKLILLHIRSGSCKFFGLSER